ncbi:metalloregulator ArsR/SmtB family transcription factor [Nocardioides marinquilinus]|uniref:Metalloregulator ArsR/SmtB family transcription factor n=1 Tax=Nocardioides marinquilinus TaxID=1210400 RepID=A0ABP9PZ90_9ACTN
MQADLTEAACLFRGLADPSRLAVLRHLSEAGEQRVVDLTAHLGLAQSTVSRHLACLAGCGLVTVRPQGRASLYALAHPGPTLQLLATAEALLAATGADVVLCPESGLAS